MHHDVAVLLVELGAVLLGLGLVGTVLIPRGEFSIVIAGLAVAAGVHDRLATLAAAYVLTLAIIGPLAARAVEPAVRAWIHRAR